MKIEKFDTLPSTNQYCELLNLSETEEFTVIVARTQTAGIGQRGNHWEAEPGKNLTFSLVLKPTWLPIADQYQLTKAVSLGIADYLMPLIKEGDRPAFQEHRCSGLRHGRRPDAGRGGGRGDSRQCGGGRTECESNRLPFVGTQPYFA